MTEESDNQQLNMIEYEEFAQSEQSTNPNIPEASLPNCYQNNYSQLNNCENYEDNGSDTERNPNNCSTEREHKDVYKKNCENERRTTNIQNVKQIQELENLTANGFTKDKKTKKQQDAFEVMPDSMDQEYLPQPSSKSRLALPSRIDQAISFHETTPIRQDIQLQDQLTSPNASPMMQTREELLEEKINHMDIIIQAQREQMTKKEEKITFLLNQISDLNNHISEQTSETSSIKVEFAKIQNEFEYLKQQQRIQNEIHSGESNIIDVQIKQEEQLIEQVNIKLSNSNIIPQQYPISSPSQIIGSKIADKNRKQHFEDLLTSSQQAETSLGYPISQADSICSKMAFRDPLPKQPYWTAGNSSVGQDKNPLISQKDSSQQSQYPRQGQSQERETEGYQQTQQQKPSTQISKSHLKTNVGHTKNAMSHDFVYKRDLVLSSFHQDQLASSPANQQQQQQYLEQQCTPVGNWSKYPFYNCLSAGPSQKRSSSNHITSSYVPLSCKNLSGVPFSILSNKDNKAKDFFDKSNTQTVTQVQQQGKHSLAKSTDPQKKSESYREQYIKNIEELQQRLEFLKQKRVEYEIKPEKSGSSQSTRIQSNFQKMYKEKSTNQSPVQSLPQSQFSMQKLHQFSTGQAIPENNNNSKNNNNNNSNSFLLGKGSNSQRQSENTLLHFNSFKKSEPLNKESYLDKQQFQASNFAPNSNYILGIPTEENYATLKPTSTLFDNYTGNAHQSGNSTNTLLTGIDKPFPKKNNGFKNQKASDITLLSGKQYFPVSSKHRFKKNEFSLQDAAFIPERDSVSPLKVQSTRNSQNNYQPLTEGLLLSTSLKKDIKTHKMSWDNLALKESSGFHFAPSSGSSIYGGSQSTKNLQLKNINFASTNRMTPIQVKNVFFYQNPSPHFLAHSSSAQW